MFAVIRVRGRTGIRKPIADTMEMINLTRKNHLSIVPEGKENTNMLKKAESYITWGELDKETFTALLKKRAMLPGKKKVSEDYLKEKKIKSFDELAEKIIKQETTLNKLGMKPIFRLSPPSKGFERKGIKKAFTVGGALGYRGKDINILIKKMM